jgi:uncharacterized protein involved in propanediol utilization
VNASSKPRGRGVNGSSSDMIAGAKHFNRSQEPEVLEKLLALAR